MEYIPQIMPSFVVPCLQITVVVCSYKTSCNVSSTQHCVLFDNTSPLSPALAMALREPTHISVSTGRPNTHTIATTSTSHLASGVERRAHVHMEPIVAEGRPNGLYNQFSLVHVDIMHRVTESFDSRMEGCWS